MKIAVIGAGIIGVTTAYELARDGHEVTVLERHLAAAEEASFATAGIVTPWASFRMPWKIARHLLGRHAPLRFHWPLRADELAWMWKCLRARRPDSYALNRARMQRLALYSREQLHRIVADLQLDYNRGQGYTVLLRSERERALMEADLQALREAGIPFRELSAEAARQLEPALNLQTPLFQAIHLPDDEVGNCRQFALLLKNEAQRLGVDFAFSTPVQKIAPASPGLQLQLAGDEPPRRFDAAVLCAGVDSARLLRPLGLKLPLAAIHGYSVSAAIREPLDAPLSAVRDERYQVAIARLGNRVRVAGGAEIGGAPARHRQDTVVTLYKVLQDWFPGAAVMTQGVQVWKGARPMLPDGPPVLGASGVPGLWLNLGHGASGWTMSCGSARAVADLIGGKSPEIDLAGLGLERLRA